MWARRWRCTSAPAVDPIEMYMYLKRVVLFGIGGLARLRTVIIWNPFYSHYVTKCILVLSSKVVDCLSFECSLLGNQNRSI